VIELEQDTLMTGKSLVDQNAMFYARTNRALEQLCTFLMSAAASLTITMSAYLESLHATRIGAFILILIVLHGLLYRRLIWCREISLYACFLCYMFIALLWTRDVELAMNTLVPGMVFLLVMILFGSLTRYSNVPTVLLGTLCGFLAGAAIYTATQGFPFSYPADFSYNAIASMYLFGLLVTLLYSCFRRSHALFLAIAIVIMLHIVATTSIKTNLGIVLGFVSAGVIYFRQFGHLLRRHRLMLIFIVAALGFAIASNPALKESLGRGVQRVLLGVEVLQAREDVAGYSAYETRDYWKQVGIEGWKLNPVFGYGTEAFRNDYGITSHSTPIDLLYNYGLIGLLLFYSVLASLIWRLLQVNSRRTSSQRALLLAGVVCYTFASLSGTMHYNIFLSAFLGISLGLLAFHDSAAASSFAPNSRGVTGQ
jgi:hypothetical protein